MNRKKYNVHITERCIIDLEKHTEFIANVNVVAAKNFRNDFLATAKSLETFPERNVAIRLSIAPGLIYRRALVGKYHALLYEIGSNNVLVDAIVDLRQNNRMDLL